MMLNDQTKPKRRLSQAPVKFTHCHAGCGAVVRFRTSPKIVCENCKPARRAEQLRLIAERRRRKSGVELIKGTVINCLRCGCSFERKGIKRRYCAPCAPEVVKERARVVSANRKHEPDGYRAHSQWYKKKRKESATHAINFRFRAAIRRVLEGGKRGRKWETLVGYTLADLMRHLERQFLPGMTWDNRSEWHIDHIIPLSSFKFETAEDPEFKAAWSLSNLRPIWAKDNLQKNAKRTHLL